MGEVSFLALRALNPNFNIRQRYLQQHYVVQKLQREIELPGHTGCVNTIQWSKDGSLLISGSDDCLVNIYHYPSYNIKHSLRTGHNGNIFGATFMPNSSNTKVLSCASNGGVRVTDVHRPEETAVFKCHRSTVYCAVPTSPDTFLTCGSDSAVREVDLRERGSCDCTGCYKGLLIKCKGWAVSGIELNPCQPYELCIAHGGVVRLYDTRNLRRRRGLLTNQQLHAMKGEYKTKSIGSCSPAFERITHISYNKTGKEILLSTSHAGVVLLSTNGERMEEEHQVTPSELAQQVDEDLEMRDDIEQSTTVEYSTGGTGYSEAGASAAGSGEGSSSAPPTPAGLRQRAHYAKRLRPFTA